MVKCDIEFDNHIASPLSPKEFIERYVFNELVRPVYISPDHTEVHYAVISPESHPKIGESIMKIRMKNIRQE